MNSPFPGMDPYLEGECWPDVHHMLAAVIREQLVPQLPAVYFTRLGSYVVEEPASSGDLGIMYPDVDVMKRPDYFAEPDMPVYGRNAQTTPPTITISSPRIVKVKIPFLEIRDAGKRTLVTVIEILSPVNKRNPGLEIYKKKRSKLLSSGVHLLEIDLLRRGTRPFSHKELPASDYVVLLVRENTGCTEAWTIGVRDTLPVVPVPLKTPDPDVRLDLGLTLRLVYERSNYAAQINYEIPPPPPSFGEKDRAWIASLLHRENI